MTKYMWFKLNIFYCCGCCCCCLRRCNMEVFGCGYGKRKTNLIPKHRTQTLQIFKYSLCLNQFRISFDMEQFSGFFFSFFLFFISYQIGYSLKSLKWGCCFIEGKKGNIKTITDMQGDGWYKETRGKKANTRNIVVSAENSC